MKALLICALALLLTGCAVQKTVSITTTPPDAAISINGTERGRGAVLEKFTFDRQDDVFYVTASRKGYQDKTVQITRDSVGPILQIDLKAHVRRISITTSPVPAIISIDGTPITAEPVSAKSTDVEFTVDANDNWKTHVIRAERRGFLTGEQVVSWTDNQSVYNVKLEAMRKDLRITTNPPGAVVSIDGEEIGPSPVTDRGRPFEYDTVNNTWVEHSVRVVKPGYDPIERKISWDNGETEYMIDLVPKQKTVRIKTDPPGAVVAIDGAKTRTEGDLTLADLVFAPINDRGDLKTYKVKTTKKTAEQEWYPAEQTIAWDEGKPDYVIKLREILSQPMDAVQLKMVREKNEWQLKVDPIKTLAMKFVTEPPGGEQPKEIVKVAKGETIGSVAISPDGQFIVYSVIGGKDGEPTSQMYRVATSGAGGPTALSDGRSLDLTPSFTASGDRIVYSSNRASKKLSIWAINSDGSGGVTRYTNGDSNDLYPCVDAEAKPRLFYQAHIDTRSDPRLYVVQLGANLQTDLTALGGLQPKVSPKNDSVVYVLPNEKTGKRDVYRVSDRGGSSETITRADADYTDPAWNFNGSRIALASDRAKDTEADKNNYDIWILELTGTQQLKQVTHNGSVDDMPVWDPSGDGIYFRSNRGGVWGIWKIPVK